VSVPRPAVHDEALDTLQEDLSCATSAVTALVAPRHRRTVRGVLVVPPGVEPPTRAPVVESDRLETWLTSLDQLLTPLEVVLVSAYLRDRLNPLTSPRTSHVPQPSPSVERTVPVLAETPIATPAPAPRPVTLTAGPSATGTDTVAQLDRRPRRRNRRRWWHPGPGTTTALVIAAGVVTPWLVALLLHAL